MKKILTIFIILNVLLISLVPQEANAAYSKVTSLAAKKIAKEAIQDAAINHAVELVTKYAVSGDSVLINNYEKPDNGFKLVCLPGGNQDVCDKPVQIKGALTTEDKTQIGNKVEEILERKTGTTGWVKWLDWIVPIFLVGTATTWITTLLDSETEDLFDQVAKESLLELGYIKSINFTGTPLPTNKDGSPVVNNTEKETITDTNKATSNDVLTKEYVFSQTGSNTSTLEMNGSFVDTVGITAYHQSYETAETLPLNTLTISSYQNSYIWSRFWLYENSHLWYRPISYTSQSEAYRKTQVYLYKNNEFVGGPYYYSSSNITVPLKISIKDIQSIFFGPEVILPGSHVKNSNYRDGNIYSDSYTYSTQQVNINMNDGTYYSLYSSTGDGALGSQSLTKWTATIGHGNNYASNIGMKFSHWRDAQMATNEPFLPDMPDLISNNSIDSSKYSNSDETIQILPPTVLPIRTPEGIPVKPSQDSATGWKDVQTGQDIAVDEETLIVSDPIRTPEGIEVPEGATIPEVPPKTQEEIKPEDFGPLGCERIKTPDFKPLTNAFTTSFPFSIPWDLYKIIENVFGGMGSEKPEFKLNFDFLNGGSWTVTIPEFFDSWVPFAKTILLVTFDISIIYLFYRFMFKG